MSYSVDYKQLFPVGDAIRQEAKALNRLILDAHDTLIQMHETWDGQRWGELATSWNRLIPLFGETCEFLVKQVPYAIEVDAYNYAVADRVSLGAEPAQTVSTNIPGELSIGTEVIKLSDENATKEKEKKAEIYTLFKKIIASLGEIEGIFNRTTSIWVGPAADNSRSKFARSKQTINDNITKIQTRIDDCINNAINDLKAQEENADQTSQVF